MDEYDREYQTYMNNDYKPYICAEFKKGFAEGLKKGSAVADKAMKGRVNKLMVKALLDGKLEAAVILKDLYLTINA